MIHWENCPKIISSNCQYKIVRISHVYAKSYEEDIRFYETVRTFYPFLQVKQYRKEPIKNLC